MTAFYILFVPTSILLPKIVTIKGNNNSPSMGRKRKDPL